jgi:prepilin-type N-terminal cleavage/methylation domain-containing protein
MKNFFKKNNKIFKNSKKGFTLVELLITISIFVILTGVVLFNQKSFDSTILIKNLAYDIALTIRQAQTYGVNVKESQSAGKFSSYGVYFDLDPVTGGNQKFVFFADNGGDVFDGKQDSVLDKKFNGSMNCLSNDVECVQKYSIKKNFYISNVCAGSDIDNCTSGNNDQLDQLTLYFQRPNPDAFIYLDNDTSVTSNKNYAEVTISSTDGAASSTIVVTNVGQIYVKK